MLKLKMMLCVMILPLVVVGCTSKAVCQSVREATTASGVDNVQPPPDWQTPLNGIISPSEADHYAKNNWKEPSILMSSADRVAHIDGQYHPQYCEQYARASSGV